MANQGQPLPCRYVDAIAGTYIMFGFLMWLVKLCLIESCGAIGPFLLAMALLAFLFVYGSIAYAKGIRPSQRDPRLDPPPQPYIRASTRLLLPPGVLSKWRF